MVDLNLLRTHLSNCFTLIDTLPQSPVKQKIYEKLGLLEKHLNEYNYQVDRERNAIIQQSKRQIEEVKRKLSDLQDAIDIL